MRGKPRNLLDGNCLLKIMGMRDSGKNAERKLANYLLDNTGRVAGLTMEQLAGGSSASYATIYRFIKKLGYPGFKEFKSSLIHSIAKNDLQDDLEDRLSSLQVADMTSIPAIWTSVRSFFNKVVNDCSSIVDPKALEAAADLLLAANSVCFIGVGTSYVSALYAYSKFMRVGVNCSHEPGPLFFKMRAELMKRSDVLFAISSSGRTQDVVGAAGTARANGVKVIALSDYAVSPLTKLADVNLYTTPRNVEAFLSIELPLIVGQIAILDVLFLRCSAKLGEPARDAYNKTRIEVDKEKK